jgi:hypothetical protein
LVPGSRWPWSTAGPGSEKDLGQKFADQFVGSGDPTDLVRLVTCVVTDQYVEIAEALEEATEEATEEAGPEPDDDALSRMGRRAERAERAERGERRRRLAAAHHLHRQIFRLRRTAGPPRLLLGRRRKSSPHRGRAAIRCVTSHTGYDGSWHRPTERLGEMLDSARDA